MSHRNAFPLIALTLLLAVLLPLSATAKPDFHMLPMSDGTRLATDVHLPKGEGPWPAILIRSAYSRNQKVADLVKDGYAVIVQELRGMWISEGDPHVFYADGWREEQHDGVDTVHWIKQQPWCTGKIATYGASALGMTQFLLAPATRELTCQCIRVAPASFYSDALYHGGVFRKNLVEGWLMGMNQPHILPIYRSHPYDGEFWRFYNSTAKAADITAPAFFYGGWYDIFQKGILDGFTARENHGGEGAKGNNYLIMRWQPHHSDVKMACEYKAKNQGPSFNTIRRAFFKHHLDSDPTALDGIPKVQYYVMGAVTPDAPGNLWRSADTWPPFETQPYSLFLQENGGLSNTAPQAAAASATFTYDPKNPYPTHGGANLFYNLPTGPQDQRKHSQTRKDFLAFATPPLQEALEVTGKVQVRLFVSSDAPDTDFTAKLIDIYPQPEGWEINLLDCIQRVKLRNSLEKPEPLLTGADQIVELTIDLWSTSYIFAPGHRIALHISSSNYPRFEINPNTGNDYALEGETLPTAQNTVHFDTAHPSALLLPVPVER